MLDLLLQILTNGLPCCILALGVFLTFRLLNFADMTAEGAFLIGSAITIVCISKGLNPFVSTIFALLGGAASGLITGILNRYLKVPKLLSGIITMTACGGIVYLILGYDKGLEQFNSRVTLGDEDTIYSLLYFDGLNRMISAAIMMAIIVLIVIFVIYFFFGTEYGMAIRSTGMNEKMAAAQGINTNLAVIVCISISNALIALSGSLIAQEMRSVTPIDSIGYLVIGLASILIGEAIFGKRSFKNWLISISLGSIIYYVIVQIAFKIGFPTQLKNLLYAILITIALCIPFVKTFFKNIFTKIRGGAKTC